MHPSEVGEEFVVTEGRSGSWHYHLSWPDAKMVSLCGVLTMPTSIPLSYWGKTPRDWHIPESWCERCVEKMKKFELWKKTCVAKYRKKPVVIEAIQVTTDFVQREREWPNWLREGWWKNHGTLGSIWLDKLDNCLKINTLEGIMRADIGDWIIQGVKGEIYACKPDIFEATYEPCEAEGYESKGQGGLSDA